MINVLIKTKELYLNQ